MRSVGGWWLALAAVLGGCGELPTPEDPGPPLWTLQVKIQGIQEGLDVSALRVAFFWTRPRDLGQQEMILVFDPFQTMVAGIGQDAGVPPVLDPQSPLTFALEFFALPEEELLVPALMAGLGRYGLGTLLLYSDRNANGALDLLPRGTAAALDQILGPVETYLVLFLDRPTSAAAVQVPWTPGISVRDGTLAFTSRAADAGANRVIGGESQSPNGDFWDVMVGPKVAPDKELPISLSLDPAKQLWMCQDDLMKMREETQIGPVEPAAIPQGAKVRCDSGNRSLSFEKTEVRYETPNCLCCDYALVVTTGTSSLPDGAPAPFGWPCR